MLITYKVRNGFASISRKVLLTICFGAVLSVKFGTAFALGPNALPEGGNGGGVINSGANVNEITLIQNTQNMIVNWNALDIGQAAQAPSFFNLVSIPPPIGGWADLSIDAGELKVGSSASVNLHVPLSVSTSPVVRLTGQVAAAVKEGVGFRLIVGEQGGGQQIDQGQTTQLIPIAGEGRYTLSGLGVYSFSTANTQAGGTGVADGATAVATHDNQLGGFNASIYLDNGKLRLTNEC